MPLINDLCPDCGRWHDHTGAPIVAMVDWRGKEWPIPRGHMPRPNGDDLGGRRYTVCVTAPMRTEDDRA